MLGVRRGEHIERRETLDLPGELSGRGETEDGMNAGFRLEPRSDALEHVGKIGGRGYRDFGFARSIPPASYKDKKKGGKQAVSFTNDNVKHGDPHPA